MATKDHDWSRFVVRVDVNAPVEKLYEAWATRQGIEYWFLRTSEYKKQDGTTCSDREFVEKGDTYRWLWHGWPDETVEYGIILDCNGKDFFSFSFGKAGNCAVTIKKEEDTTIVELVQYNIPVDEVSQHQWHIGCKTGWTFYLSNMKSLYEGGIDLRNKNVKLQEVLNS